VDYSRNGKVGGLGLQVSFRDISEVMGQGRADCLYPWFRTIPGRGLSFLSPVLVVMRKVGALGRKGGAVSLSGDVFEGHFAISCSGQLGSSR